MKTINWTCPFCSHHAAITGERMSQDTHRFEHGNRHGKRYVATKVIVCPNPECCEFTLTVSLGKWKLTTPTGHYPQDSAPDQVIALVPAANMMVFPDYIPNPILADYREACLVRDLSPKASATLARRCLQGMIRDFHGVSKRKLIDEIEGIKDKVDPLTWNAISAVRSIGNIGAHMETDINVVVDVEPGEAQLLIGLIETLLQDWYINRHERERDMSVLVAAAEAKAADRHRVANSSTEDAKESSSAPISPSPNASGT